MIGEDKWGKDKTCNHKMAKGWCISIAKSPAGTNLKGVGQLHLEALGANMTLMAGDAQQNKLILLCKYI